MEISDTDMDTGSSENRKADSSDLLANPVTPIGREPPPSLEGTPPRASGEMAVPTAEGQVDEDLIG
eukprot:5930274-Alexandrium_andersonii.AAC.1